MSRFEYSAALLVKRREEAVGAAAHAAVDGAAAGAELAEEGLGAAVQVRGRSRRCGRG